jgi:putative pyruvate formate lyase activating enzyme
MMNQMEKPAYVKYSTVEKLKALAAEFLKMYECCELCPRKCRVNRLAGEKGICSSGVRVKVAAAHPHFGEESCLVGQYGSGAIFFSNCNLLCLYCQNWEISHHGSGTEIEDAQLANVMVQLQEAGCANINLVTPAHYLPNIINALVIAIDKGLHIPLVYNTSGYERVQILRKLNGIIDIYLPDMKYSCQESAEKYSKIPAADYPEVVRKALKEMHRQVGHLKINEYGSALFGLIVRHLLLPDDLAGTEACLKFIADHLDEDVHLNIMNQYRPEFEANQFPELSRPISQEEFNQALALAKRFYLNNID